MTTATTTSTTTTASQQLRGRSVAYALLARILGPDATALTDDASIDALHAALDAAGDDSVLARIVDAERFSVPESQQLTGRWVRWFDLGRVAPYEGSNIATTVGGITPRLADVAGFYRAFGVVVSGDRPDHVVAQLEFLALTLLLEAEAIEQGDGERARIVADATRGFLRDHVGVWIDAWAARVGEIEDLAPWFPYAAAAADLVRGEAANRNVIPLRDAAALLADAGIASDAEATLACEDEEPPTALVSDQP